jgi:hypothetical protein
LKHTEFLVNGSSLGTLNVILVPSSLHGFWWKIRLLLRAPQLVLAEHLLSSWGSQDFLSSHNLIITRLGEELLEFVEWDV